MNNTAWLVFGAVAIVGAYLYYRGKVVAGKAEASAHPGTALNTLATNTPQIIAALGDAFGEDNTAGGVYGGYA